MKKKILSDRELYLRNISRDKRKILFIQIAALAAFIGFWELSTAVGWVAVSYTHLTLPTKRIV